MFIPRGVKLYQLPAALEKYIQEKGASGLGELFLLPWCFPVFIMNPSDYYSVGAWYDRNPKPLLKQFGLSLIPHSATQRFAYTVPARKKAFLEFAETRVIRLVTATALGLSQAMIFYSDGTSYEPLLLAELYSNNLGDRDMVAIGQAITMLEGHRLDGYTYDGSTDGACGYFLCAKITEFDA